MREEPSDAGVGSATEEVLHALKGSYTMELLGLVIDDLDEARTDPILFETLRITHEMLLVLRDEGVLRTFLKIPRAEQINFVRWIGGTGAEDTRRQKTEAFVAALKASPLAEGDEAGEPSSGE